MSEPFAFEEAADLGRAFTLPSLAMVLVLTSLFLGCRPREAPEPEEVAAEPAETELSQWVKWYQPEQSSAGFNLLLHKRRTPVIRDMNGREVHSWPNVRATGRVRLSRDGRLLVIGADSQIKEYDWSGELIRTLPLATEESLPHHDLIELENGNYMLLALDGRRKGDGDYLLEVDPEGRRVWEWRALDHRESLRGWVADSHNPTHINSVRELPPNRWFDSGDERFRPGNLLLSGRNLNTVFIIDRSDGSVQWQYSEGLVRQHEAVMLGKELEDAGMIILFNNGEDDPSGIRGSKVELIDPPAGVVKWRYEAEFFFSSTGGLAQPLAGGRTLIASSQGGRVFEVTREGRIVWEWAPSYKPMRVERLAYDHCPQLAALALPKEVQVTPEDYEPFVSRDLYDLYFRRAKRERTVGGNERTVLLRQGGCRGVVIPPRAWLKVDFGFDESRLPEEGGSVRFKMTLRREEGLETLFDVELYSDSDELWISRRILLTDAAYESLQVCYSIESDDGGPVKQAALWGTPVIVSAARVVEDSEAPAPLSKEERRLRKRQLEALGYVN